MTRARPRSAASAAGFGFSRFGGGYVDQKWRPHFGQTQNWSGFHGVPGRRIAELHLGAAPLTADVQIDFAHVPRFYYDGRVIPAIVLAAGEVDPHGPSQGDAAARRAATPS